VARARRGRGEGSIYYREDLELWCSQISLGYDAQGKRKRRTIYGKTKREVQEKLRKMQADVDAGVSVEPNRLTVAQHLADWLHRKKASVKSGTMSRLVAHAKHIEAQLGGIRLKDLDHRKVAAFYATLEDLDLSERYIYDIAATLRMLLRDAVDLGYIPRDPAAKVKRSYEKEEARFLTQDEFARFFAAARGERLEDAFILAVHTGLRPGEWLGLSWDAVDLEAAKLDVRQALHEEEGRVFIGGLKTKAARRTISLSQAAVQALRRQRRRQNAARLKAGSQWANEANLVFTSIVGTPLRRSNIYHRDLPRIIKRAREQMVEELIAAGWTKTNAQREAAKLLEGISLHTFRHTHAAILIAQGVDIKTIQRRLGHERVQITLDLYGHLLPGQDERAAERMDEFVASLPIGSS